MTIHSTMRPPEREQVRAMFPGLLGPDVLLDNAGGSQIPQLVADRIRNYMLQTYVQLGAAYRTSRHSTAIVDRAHTFLRMLMNGDGIGEVVIGSSTSALCGMLADCYARAPVAGRDEVVVCDGGHEANIGPWTRLADRGFTVRTWRIRPDSHEIELSDLEALLSERTRIVAVHHVSNLLGRIEDIRGIVDLAHAHGARVVVDGVAYAPHRAIDVAAWNVDWYVFSTYKVYGPHAAVLFGTHTAFAELEGPNFYFIDREDVPYKFELGGPSHEACAGILGLWDYLCFLAGRTPEGGFDRATIEQAFVTMARLEEPLQGRLLAFLRDRPSVRSIGPAVDDDRRVPTVSFVQEGRSSRDLAEKANAAGLGIRHGHFYAHRLTRALDLEPEDGVVRTSLVHYNDPSEVERLLEFFDQELR